MGAREDNDTVHLNIDYLNKVSNFESSVRRVFPQVMVSRGPLVMRCNAEEKGQAGVERRSPSHCDSDGC